MKNAWWMILLCACTSGGNDITDKGDDTDVPADDTDAPTDDTDTTDTTPAESAIEGDWVSQGADVAPLLAGPPSNTVRIDATFHPDGSYEALSESDDGSTYTFEGTYTVDESTDPATIEIAQTAPYVGTVQGIWSVDGGVLTYDIVDIAFGTPPTVAGGFGSSSAGAANVQTYRRP